MRGLTICCSCLAVLVSIVPETKGEEFSLVTQVLDQGYSLYSSDDEIPSMEMRSPRPPLRKGRVAAEIAVGTGAGIGGGVVGATGLGVVGWLIGTMIDPGSNLFEVGTGSETGMFIGMVVGGLIGGAFGTATGVCYIGRIGDETGSFLATLLGTMSGMSLGLAIYGLIASNDALEDWAYLNYEASFALPSYFVSALGATVGFNLTRRYDKPSLTGTSTFSHRNNAAMHPDRVFSAGRDSLRGRDCTQRISLVGMEF